MQYKCSQYFFSVLLNQGYFFGFGAGRVDWVFGGIFGGFA
jgi:hypothetical protein